MQAGCRTCRHADYTDAANGRDGCDFDHDDEEEAGL